VNEKVYTTQLTDLIHCRLAWKGHFEGRTLPSFTEHSIGPEPGYPLGRKGMFLASLWRELAQPTTDGFIINDGDVVVDPHDYNALLLYVASEKDAVWTAPVKLWPKATQLPEWIWGHRKPLDPSLTIPEVVKAWQEDVDDPVMFSFCFTWLPRRLMLAALEDGLETWRYPKVDWNMWETAQKHGIPVHTIRDCHPRHLNY
jgi:hypothetical protein